ncbi:MAG: hypothetical protein COT15_03350 [Candidatus Diapherotrites archaeon CG08_land_8_20_14_0_20_34_12]|nr:MAG: hypothetical protein COT15_03350 [Candidatus Diapherotrites archaeon CG08_land_8_20_14_0_20_34_12]
MPTKRPSRIARRIMSLKSDYPDIKRIKEVIASDPYAPPNILQQQLMHLGITVPLRRLQMIKTRLRLRSERIQHSELRKKGSKIKRVIMANEGKTNEDIAKILADEGIRTTPETISMFRAQMKKAGISVKRAPSKQTTKTAVVRAAILEDPDAPPRIIRQQLLHIGKDVPIQRIVSRRRRLGIKGSKVQYLDLNSKEAAISKAIFYNKGKNTDEIQKALATQGIETTKGSVRTIRAKMRREGIEA